MFSFILAIPPFPDGRAATPIVFLGGLLALSAFYLVSKAYDRLSLRLAHYMYQPEMPPLSVVPEPLRRASERGARLDFTLTRDDGSSRSVPCRIMSCSDGGLEIEAPAWLRSPQVLIGKSAACFFQVRDERTSHGQEHYQFESRVRGFRTSRDGMPILQLDSPLWMNKTQRRQYLRVNPPMRYFADFSAWNIKAEKLPMDALGRANMSVRPESLRTYRVLNMSAGGALLSLDVRTFRNTGLSTAAGTVWLVRLMLKDPAKDRYVKVWTKAEVIAARHEGLNKDMEVSLKFAALAVQGPEAKEFQWQDLNESGIEAVESWVFGVTMEYYRQGRQEFIM